MRIRSITALALSTAVVLAGCTSTTSAGDTTPTPDAQSGSPSPVMSPTPEVSATSDAFGSDPSTWAPLIVTPASNGALVQLVEEQRIVFDELPARDELHAGSSNKDVITVEPAQEPGSEQVTSFNATAVGPGAARVVVWSGTLRTPSARRILQLVFQVTPKPDASGETTTQPTAPVPVVVSADMTEVSVAPGTPIVFGDVQLDGARWASSNPNAVFFPTQPGTNGNPFAIAIGEGESRVRVFAAGDGPRVRVRVTVTPSTATPAADGTPEATPTSSPTS